MNIKIITLITFALSLSSLAVAAGNLSHEDKKTKVVQFSQIEPFNPFQLQDLNLQPITEEYFVGQWDLVFLGYTNCPDVCPTTMNTMANALKKIDSIDHGKPSTRIVFMSADPARDAPLQIKNFLGYFHPKFAGFSGPINTLQQVAKDMNMIFYYGEADKKGNYEVAHSASIAIIDPQGRIAAHIKNPKQADEVVKHYLAWRDTYAPESVQ